MKSNPTPLFDRAPRFSRTQAAHIALRAFTLIELITVMAIIILIATFVTPAATSILKGNQLTQASEMVSDQLGYARQSALALNQPVEVRFYQYGDPSVPGESISNPTTWRYNAMQLFQITSSGAVPFGKVQVLPNTIIIDSGSTLSSIIVSATTSNVSIPRVGTNYNYVPFRFLVDGSTNLSPPTGSFFLTLHNFNYGDGLAAPPPNFFTLQVDPVNGHVKKFHPGI